MRKLVIAIGVVLFAALVWPTAYRYEHMASGVLVRINRLDAALGRVGSPYVEPRRKTGSVQVAYEPASDLDDLVIIFAGVGLTLGVSIGYVVGRTVRGRHRMSPGKTGSPTGS